jgi:DNA polymerase I-like protein with 3'-5' exonuclease and polymerase domains
MGFLESFEESTRHDVAKRPWMDHVHMELITEDTLDRVIDECIASGRYALDLETTGLDNRVFDGRTRDQIVGFCLSPDGKRGYYIPIRHRVGEDNNLPIPKVETAIRRLVESPSIAIFHNAKFDHEFLQFCGGEPLGTWDDARRFEDTLIQAWLRNTRQKTKGLKFMSKTELGKDMIELDELFPPGYKGKLDFSELDPSWDPCIWYACSDAICTFLLDEVLQPQVIAPEGDRTTGQEVIYNIEKMCVPATRWMERCRVPIDEDKVAELMRLGQQELFDCLRDVYDFCNKTLGRTVEPGWFEVLRTSFNPNDPSYDINQQIENCRKDAKRLGKDELDHEGHYVQISKTLALTIEGKEETFESFPEKYDVLSREQLGVLFCELEIPDLTRTGKSDQIQTTQEVIDHLEEMHGDKYPFLPKIKRLGELQKALGTYLISLHRDKGPDNTIKVNYNQFGTDTGRYTTPAAKNPAEDGGCKYPMHGTPATYDKSRPQCLLRIREAIKARPGKVMVSIDYGGVELRIATILSGEPKWLTEYFRCSTCGMEFDRGDGRTTPMPPPGYCPKCGDDKIGDLHTATAITFHGADSVGGKEWKQQRQGAKSANFAMAYGGGASAIRRATGCDEVEAARHHRSFTTTNSVLKGWWDQIKSFGRVHGYVKTEFGRRYPIPDILLSLDPNQIRAELMADENRPKYVERVYDMMRRFYRIKSKKSGFTYDPDKNPLELAVRATLYDYRADLTAGHKKPIDDGELKKKLIDSVKKAEAAVINEQVDRNKKFKAKAERNATNGPIQGLSADITKIAMALIYKECRKRGWLSKVLMLITIHDELVFEIDEDILAEAIELFQDIMARNKTILNMKWAVPLTTDCEIGFDWTVPWNIKDFKYRRVRPDGLQTDEHGRLPRDKKTGKLVAKRWPEKFVKIFGPGYGFAPVLENPTQEEGVALFGPNWQPLPLSEAPTEPTQPLQAVPSASSSPTPGTAPAIEPPDPEDMEEAPIELVPTVAIPRPLATAPAMPARPRLDKDEVYEFRVHSLAVGAAFKLAQVIVQCQGKGMNRLKVSGPEGEDLLWPGADIRVSPVEFTTAAGLLGL